MAFNKSIPNLIGGKTQETFTSRQDNEVENETNCYNNVNAGLIRRTGSYIVDDLPLSTDDILSLNTIEHKDGFMIVDTNKNVKFFKKDGAEYTTSFETPETESNFNTYLSGTPDLGFLNLNDLTYLYNRNIEAKNIQTSQDLYEISREAYLYGKTTHIGKNHSVELKYAFDPQPTMIQTDKVFYTPSTGLSQAQLVRSIASASRDNLGNETDFTDGNFYNEEGKVYINWSTNNGWVNFATDIDVTIIGDKYDDFTDSFVRTEESFVVPSGTHYDREPITTSAWGSIKKITLGPVVVTATPGDSFQLRLEYGSKTKSIFLGGSDYEWKAKYDVSVIDSFVKISPLPWGDLFHISNITTNDNADNLNFYTIFGTMSNFEALPSRFINKATIKLTGDQNSEEDDFVVKFKVNNSDVDGEYGSGVWIESGLDQFPYDLTTMPFSIIINDLLQTVLINDGGWKERLIGDTITNKDPYFLNKKINDLFIFGSRLSILSGGDKIDLSGTNDFFNFYRTTVTSNIDSDRISIVVNSDKLINLTRSSPFNENVLLIDDDTQFLMSFEGGLSINTLQVQEISSFNTKSKLKPIRTNDSLFFVSDYSNNSQIIKFNAKDISLVQGLDITDKVKSLLPNQISSTCTNNANDMFFVHKKNENKIFMYSYKIFQGEGEYGAWCELDFTGYNILFIDCIDDELFLFCNGKVANEIRLLKINLSNDTGFENGFQNEFFRIHTDKKEIVLIKDDARNIDGSGNQKQFLVVPYNVPYNLIVADNIRVVATGENGSYFKYGTSYTIESVDEDINGNAIVTIENPRYDISVTDSKFVVDDVLVGELFPSEVELSKVNLKNRDGLPMNSGTTQLLGLNLTFGKTGGFKVNTDIVNAGEYDEIFTGKIVGTNSAVIGEVNVESGSKSFYLGAEKNEIKIKIKNLDYLPFEIQSGEYEIEYDSITSTY